MTPGPGPGTLAGPPGWVLTPEGAAVYTDEATAVVADVHLGYEWARGAGGDCIPPHSLAETSAKLASLFGRVRVTRLVVAGDFVESRRFCRRTARDVARLTAWLGESGVELVCLAGNHDPPRRPPLPPTFEVGGWTVAHGHREVEAGRTVTGHLHPVLRAPGVTAPCFLVGPGAIVLPAFSPNTAGVGLGSLPRAVGAGTLRCVAAAGGALLDFGPAGPLLRAIEAGGPAVSGP